MTQSCNAVRALGIVLLPALLHAQATIVARPLGAIVARSGETFGSLATVRQLNNGDVLVNDAKGHRVLLLDSALNLRAVVSDTSGSRPNTYGAQIASLIPYTGDSTLLVDASTRSVVVLNAAGVPIHSIAPPRAQDVGYLSNEQLGLPNFVGADRLIYRGIAPGTQSFNRNITQAQPPPPDSAPVVRADLNARVIDTLIWVRISVSGPLQIIMGADGHVTGVKALVNPLRSGDDWIALHDGGVAVVRTQSYRIDWVDANGQRRSTPRMPYPWQRLTDDEKQRYADSAVANMRKPFADAARGGNPVTLNIESVPLSEIPDYIGAVSVGTSREAPDGTLWILPSISTEGGATRLYDVVSRLGVIVERVRVPVGRSVIAFGAHGNLYLAAQDADGVHLEVARVR